MFEDNTKSGMDLSDPDKRRIKRYESPIPANTEPKAAKKKQHGLDSDSMTQLHGRLLGFYQQEIDRQAENRRDMALDEDFYDNIQWDEADAAQLRERGQMPLVYNVIASAVNWVIGSEKRGRTDFKILPRRKEDGRSAERKTALVKYVDDVNRAQFHRSRAFEDTVKVGLGWLENGVQNDDDGEPVYARYESWRNMLWDSACTEMDLSDARYVFRTKWVDLDIARAMFPQRKGVVELSVDDSDTWGLEYSDEAMDQPEREREESDGMIAATQMKRERVRLIECWYRSPVQVQRLSGSDFGGEVYDPNDPIHAELLQAGEVVLADRVMMRMHCVVMTVTGMLYHGVSPYKHNRFPFTPIWAYRRGRDGLPYGMVRGLRDIQQDINKRASKALHILSTNKTIMDKGAVDDLAEFQDEISRPDAIIVKNPGKDLIINAERELSDAHLDMMSRSIAMVQQQSGVTDELMGKRTNATSGVAIQRRQEQGSMATAKLFDNLRFACQLQGELELSLIEQFFTEQKAFRITNMRGAPEFVTINDGMPENDIARTKADFVISESDWQVTMRQAAAEELMEMMTRLPPEVVMVMLDLVVESMDLPNREEIVKRIRQVTGQKDPDSDELTPEDIQKAQAQQKQQQMQEQMFMAELANKQADAQKKAADAQRAQVQSQHILSQLAGQNVATQKAALEAALAALSMPPAVPVADTILKESGFVSRTEGEATMAQAARAQEEEARFAQEQQAMAEQQAQEQQAIQQQAQAEQQAMQQQAPQQPGMPPQNPQQNTPPQQ